ncbi:MAG TPA: hypothetical protein VHM27_02405 [Rhizomicrobium sp.]|nr:hypothetical protein [Rhizomicrobium sp.]
MRIAATPGFRRNRRNLRAAVLFPKSPTSEEWKMKLVTIAAVAALAATPALADPFERAQARADLDQASTDAVRAEAQKEDAEAQADLARADASRLQAQANAAQAEADTAQTRAEQADSDRQTALDRAADARDTIRDNY